MSMDPGEQPGEAVPRWVAISYGALDVSGVEGFPGAELLVTPTLPTIPLALPVGGAQLWRRLVEGPVADSDLSADERVVVREMAAAGLASDDVDHPHRHHSVEVPWLSSPMHELVYALVQRVADEVGVPVVFIKGPMLHRQGLRKRKHSGDVDVWAQPDRIPALVEALEPWGGELQPDPWGDLPINHSLTVGPIAGWGCEIDVHRRLPGLALSDGDAFQTVRAHSEPATFAGVRVAVPRRELNAALSALHTMRPEVGIGTKPGAEAEAVAVLRSGGPGALRAVREIDALRALQAVLPQAFPDESVDGGGEPRDWYWRGEPDKAHSYFVALKQVPWHRRPAIVFRLVWPKSDVAIASSRLRGDSARGLFWARLVRLKHGLSALRRAPSRKR